MDYVLTDNDGKLYCRNMFYDESHKKHYGYYPHDVKNTYISPHTFSDDVINRFLLCVDDAEEIMSLFGETYKLYSIVMTTKSTFFFPYDNDIVNYNRGFRFTRG
jgi:hypothetical protein